jgi:pyruvate dehydrogenase E2 component (dihydrolipoamide acetyltransferase)
MGTPVYDVLLPQLGMGMSEGEIVEWLAREGDHVTRDQPLVSIENEKTVTELPAPSTGFVHLLARVGDKLLIETVIARIAHTEGGYRALVEGREFVAHDDQLVQPGADVTNVVALAAGAELAAALVGASPSRRIHASGRARELARNNALDLATIEGTGPDGRIVERDVLNHLSQHNPGELRSEAITVPAGKDPDIAALGVAARGLGPSERGTPKAKIPLIGVRRTIAERMVRSSTEAAQAFVFFEVDATDLLRIRKSIDERLGESQGKITAVAYYAKAVALACQRVPIANATLEGNEIIVWNEVNVGIAVALPGATEFDSSLIVPVVHGAESLDLATLSRRIREQVQKAREGKLVPADLRGGTITISTNAGMFPGMWVNSTALLNLPQAIIFQPGNATKRPVVIDDEIVIRTILPCSLTFDHRCLDGEPIARFIRELSGFLTHPETMMLGNDARFADSGIWVL